jgi:hypothetical protein
MASHQTGAERGLAELQKGREDRIDRCMAWVLASTSVLSLAVAD